MTKKTRTAYMIVPFDTVLKAAEFGYSIRLRHDEAENIVRELVELLFYNVWPYIRSHDVEKIKSEVFELINKLEKLAK